VAGLIRWSVEAAAKEARSVAARFIILDPNGEYRDCFKDLAPLIDVRVFSAEPKFGESELMVPAWMWNGQEWAVVEELARQGVLEIMADEGFDPVEMARAVIKAADGDVVPLKRAST
jgi:hypothetical protein